MPRNRKDAKYVKPKDGIQAITPYIMSNRTEAEVSSKVILDITKLMQWVDKQNEENKLGYKLTFFHAFACILSMTIFNRPALNCFIKNKRLYQRNDLILSFVAKNKMTDKGEEKLVFLKVDPNDTGYTLSHKMAIDIFKAKGDHKDNNSMNGKIDFVTHLPRWLLSFIIWAVNKLDDHGMMPRALSEGDTDFSTCILSNLGSVKTNSCYHHLNNYGTNSFVLTIGIIKEENNKKTVDFTATLDERIADGFYFSRSFKYVQYIANHPELLEGKLSKKIEID